MKVAHICLSCFYIDGFSYQENDLVKMHVDLGHEVQIIASTESIGPNGKIRYLEPSTYIGSEGAQVTRLPYRKLLPHKIMRKLRMHPSVYDVLENFEPEVILFHGACGWEIITVAKYAAAHPQVRFYIDSHEDWNNSARNFVSREFLHRRFYGPVLRKAAKNADKILCVSTEVIDFVHDLYKIEREKLEFFPLGGHLIEGADYDSIRTRKRAELGLEDEICILQSGKQTKRKKLLEALHAFSQVNDSRLRFYIAGILDEEIASEAEVLIGADPRVEFLGWQSKEQLNELLCAADVYLQPGTQSATLQHSLCTQCAVIIDNVPAHKIYKQDNGWFLDGTNELTDIFANVATSPVEKMQENSLALAKRILDYKELANRILI